MEQATKTFICEVKLRVRYSETDGMAVVYHANYLPWFECARNEYCRALGYPYKELEEREGAFLMVTELGIKYNNPARFDDEVVVRTWCEQMGRASCTFGYQVWDATTNKLCVEGWSEHAAVDKVTGKLRRFSPELYAAFAQHLGPGPAKFTRRKK